MKLTGLHLLLTYQCTFECDHCFLFGSPQQSGTMTLATVRKILEQADELGTVEWIYFEGGEPFLYYVVMLEGARLAAAKGYKVGIVSNAFWASNEEDATEWLKPLAGIVHELSVSSDLYHYSEKMSQQAQSARAAAEKLGIPIGVMSIAQPKDMCAQRVTGQLPQGETAVLYRGRAAEKLIGDAPRRPWELFTECPCEDLHDPGRVHIDPLGHLHICQGISLGNLFKKSLAEICATYSPKSHPITGPLAAGGPAELARQYWLPTGEGYADACHLCFEARGILRKRFPDELGPDQMYGVPES